MLESAVVKPPFRLLAVDIDGTLLNSRFEIAAEDLAALQRVHAAGVEVILCTGRRHAFALPIASRLGFALWLCSSNGAVTRSTQGETFHRDLLPAGTAREICAHMAAYRAGTVLTFDQETKGALVVERTDQLVATVRRWVEMNESYIERIIPLESALHRDPIQVMVCGTLAGMRDAEAHLAAFPGREAVTVLKTQYDHRDLCLLDILNRECSKGHAVERWAEEQGIEREAVMAIGDNFNDLAMLQYAGFPVVMGNASAEMKSFGWLETRTNDEGGLAAAIEMVCAGAVRP